MVVVVADLEGGARGAPLKFDRLFFFSPLCKNRAQIAQKSIKKPQD